ncbi:hypothetical protein AN396_01565 [Candidatus Epulonipiscium fishelsonii]|uniref:Uncharacterized protein n=1 Tax=Candidatus Epulonipiscium fishelsonii TaxID=77094 RepID=A0ACC8X8A6_9FIRM|nr:hypothetical protein AN396_01565 [Epulopiscium sp. SCG-B11WGA-EpuloA1]
MRSDQAGGRGEAVCENVRRTKDEGRRTRDEGRRTRDEGRRTKDEGRRTRDEGRRTRDEGRRTRDEGRRTKDEGRRTKDEGSAADVRQPVRSQTSTAAMFAVKDSAVSQTSLSPRSRLNLMTT